MPLVLNGSTGITTDNIADGTIAAGDLASTLNLSSKTLTLPTVPGTIVQVLGAENPTETSISGSYSNVTDHGAINSSTWYVDITPTKANSKLVIFLTLSHTKNTWNVGVRPVVEINGNIVNDITGTSFTTQQYNLHRQPITGSSYYTQSNMLIYQCSSVTNHRIKCRVQIYDETSSFTCTFFGSNGGAHGSLIRVMEIAG